MRSNSDKPKAILVTGAHRSGTTWVGKMLTASREAAYISEPFNRWHRPGVYAARIQNWYPYVCVDNEQAYLKPYSQMLNYHYHGWKELQSLRSGKDAMRMIRDANTFITGWIFHRRPLIKDPFAFFSVPWINSTFSCAVVITVRHPAAFVSSLKRLDWPFDFRDFIDQPLLVRDILSPYYNEMQEAMAHPDDLVGNGSLLWRILYQVSLQFVQKYPAFILVKHEDLSKDPLSGFQALYFKLGLNLTAGAKKNILNSSASNNPKEISRQDKFGTRVDSQANLSNWKRRLSTSEIDRIREITADISSTFYDERDWEF